MDDFTTLREPNLQFIEAFRRGSWELLEPILSPAFSYLDGATGEVWTQKRYVEDLQDNALSTIGIDQVAVHVDGDVAVVSGRSFTSPDRYNRYVDTYVRRGDGWRCAHACVWPLQGSGRDGRLTSSSVRVRCSPPRFAQDDALMEHARETAGQDPDPPDRGRPEGNTTCGRFGQ